MSKLIEQFTGWVRELSKNFYLSLTSSDFYSDLYINHKGYGFKYLINLCILSSLILCSSLIVRTHYQKQIFDEGSSYQNGISASEVSYEVSKEEKDKRPLGELEIEFPKSSNDSQRKNRSDLEEGAIDLNYLINQFPILEYDGQSISYDGKMPFYIKLHNGKNVAVIDLEGETLSANKSSPVPVVFKKTRVNISFLNLRGELEAVVPLEYKNVFGSDPGFVSQSTIREALSRYFDYAPRIIIYAFFPIFSCFLFGLAIFQNLATIVILLLGSFLFCKNVSWKGCIRLVIFSAASVTIVQSLLFFSAPELLSQKWILGLWVNFLVVVGLFKVLKVGKNSIVISGYSKK